ncbi:hypothetical protein [Streptacidiphilus sp. EB103A]|uniref:hypothetical protein n=1 Tax=Streptacidiphilus sp. EB103A TaxID=3156275 RepID=UPI003512648B
MAWPDTRTPGRPPGGGRVVQSVAKHARLLRASLLGHTQRDTVYEAYQPEPGPMVWDPSAGQRFRRFPDWAGS